MSQEISFTVPLVPPSVNHYVKHTRSGRHYVTADAKAFKSAISIFCPLGSHVVGSMFEVEAVVYLGEGQRGDVDGFGKLILDGLAEAAVFQRNRPGHKSARFPIRQQLSDAYVTDFILRKRRDRKNPRTEITVRALTGVTQ